MSKANVSINALNNFKISIEDFNNELKNLETGLSDFESCLNSIKDEKQKFDDKEIEIQKSIRSIDGKISIIEKEIKEIEKELSNLYRKLSTVKPRIKVKYTRRVGTNSEGQPIYSTYVVEEPNPEYVAIQNQINQVRSKLKEKKEKLNKGKEIKQKLDDSYKELKLIVEILEVSKIQLEYNKEEIQKISNNNMNASTSAIETLNKAEAILNNYLDESLILTSSNNSSTIGVFGAATTMNYNKTFIESTFVTEKEKSYIYNEALKDSDYYYAREAYDKMEQYYNDECKQHLYKRLHIKDLPECLLTDDLREKRNLENINSKNDQSKFYDNISLEEIEELISIGLLNCKKIKRSKPNSNPNFKPRSIYQVKFPCNIGTTNRNGLGAAQITEDTPYLTIIIGYDVNGNERIISTFPGRCRIAVDEGIY